jgi:hypothetical protein
MTDAPCRIQRSRAKGWRMPENTVYVGRPTRWGNPFSGPLAAERFRLWLGGKMSVFEAATLMNWPCSPLAAAVINDCAPRELRGKNLACWCALDQPCHADVLLEIANAPLRCEGVDRAAGEAGDE